MNTHFQRISGWYFKNERRLSSLGLLGGFIFDIFTLTRIDHTLENFWIGFHLIVAAIGIIFINLYEEGKLRERVEGRAHFWWTFVIQFAYGGLFSVYLVFYTRSGSIFASWPFLLLLLLIFVANERLRDRYIRLDFEISTLFFALLFYLIYIVPIIVGNISSSIFILSGVVSLIIIVAFILLLAILTPQRIKKEKWLLFLSIGGIYILMNVLYFSHLIPPIPLSLKQGGIYHSIEKSTNGYTLTEEASESGFFYRYLVRKPTIHLISSNSAYTWSAIFAPTDFSVSIVHRWEYYDETKKEWVTSSVIPLNIVGGRDGGFRTYSKKSGLFTGKWRVRVETTEGQVMGLLNFDVQQVDEEPLLVSIKK